MKRLFLLILLFSFSITSMAQQKVAVKTKTPVRKVQNTFPQGKVFGIIFSDYSYILQEPQIGNNAKGTSGKNMFLLRRANIGYEYFYTSNISARIVYNAAANNLEQANVQLKNLLPLVDFQMGMMQTLSSAAVEKIWNYRSLDQSILDRLGYTNEFDAGAALTGRSNPQGTLYGTVAVYNGTGTFADNDKLKKIGFAAGNWFDNSNLLELYVDYENVGSGKSILTGKFFYGLTTSAVVFGVEGFYRMNRKFAGTKDIVPAGGSIFTEFDLAQSLGGVLRIDGFDNDLNQSNIGYREIYLNAGIDYTPVKDVHLIPNLVYKKQLKKGTTVVNANYMEARLTAAVEF